MERLKFAASPSGCRCLLNNLKTVLRSYPGMQCNFSTAESVNSFTKNSSIGKSYVLSRLRCKNSLSKTGHRSTLLRGFTSQAGEGTGPPKISLWKRLAVVGTVAGAVGYSYYTVYRNKIIREEQVRYEEFKKAKLGGDWTLIDHHGKQRSSTEFRGQWILLYFGFTHCPDICPEELEKLVRIVKHFDTDPKLPNMKPLFITLDPERDTPMTIKDYLEDFKCPSILGFTAPTVEAIKEVATKYRAYFTKGIPDEDNDYIVDHTIIIYVINPDGEFVNYFDRSRSAKQVITTVTDHIQKYNELKSKS